MQQAKFIQLNHENISKEHICCAISDKKCVNGYNLKKQWLKNQFDDGYVFRKLDVRGKVFIEYVPTENAWIPIHAPKFILINCFWVSGKYKNQGFGKQLYLDCENDAKSQNKDGIAVIVANKKQPFMSEKKFFQKQGFQLADTANPYFELWYKALKEDAEIPKFKAIAKSAECDIKEGLAVYYTNACPFTDYYTNVVLKERAEKHDISLTIKHLQTREEAQNHFVPHTIYSIFLDGKFVTQQILSEKSFEKMILKQ